jgi:Na+-transporting NADH:ubiquinone oxidoreductase subunit NqrE
MRTRRRTRLGRVRGYFLFEAWSFTDPALIAQWRTTWPSWRQAIRPVGATAWWLAVVLELIFDDSGPAYVRALGYVLSAVAVTCAAIGIGSYVKAGRELGLRHRFRAAAGAS